MCIRDSRRTVLAHAAWVDLRPGWLTGSDEMFMHLRRTVDWHGERRRMYERVVDVPRLLRFYGADEPLPHRVLAAAREALSAYYAPELGEPFTTAGMCLYRDGRDSVAWHGDTIGRSRTEDTMVAIVSLGTPRPLLLRPRGGGNSLRYVAVSYTHLDVYKRQVLHCPLPGECAVIDNIERHLRRTS